MKGLQKYFLSISYGRMVSKEGCNYVALRCVVLCCVVLCCVVLCCVVLCCVMCYVMFYVMLC